MTNIQKFHNDLVNWLACNGFSNCDVGIGEDFCYNFQDHIIFFGAQSNDEGGICFQQHLYEYGCENAPAFWYPVLCFLHEACHHLTIGNFTDDERTFLSIMKSFIDNETNAENYDDYWHIADEFIANMCVVNFINSHFDAVAELQQIIIEDLSTIQDSDQTLWDFIEKVE